MKSVDSPDVRKCSVDWVGKADIVLDLLLPELLIPAKTLVTSGEANVTLL